MTNGERTADDAVILEPGAGPALWFLRNRLTVKATAEQTGGFSLFEYELPPGSSPPLHVHRREEEAFYVLEGVFTMRCGDRTFTAEPGAFLLLPRDVPHSFVVEGDKAARMLTILTPGHGLGFFTDNGTVPTDAGLPPLTPVDQAALAAAAAEYGVDIIGPPLQPFGI